MRVLAGEALWPPPIWLMRQAGRHLPEYREVRARAGSFMDLCFTPELAAEVTLQPIRRYGLDGAILFSDILVVPHALGQAVSVVEHQGPRLEPVANLDALGRLAEELPLHRLAPVFETLDRLKAALPGNVTLLGFCGAPWTVASYMIAGKGTPDQAPARVLAYADPAFMAALIDRLIAASTSYLVAQIDAGAEAVQIFESFGAALPPALVDRLSLDPIRRILAGVRAARPGPAPSSSFGAAERICTGSPRRGSGTRSRSIGSSIRPSCCRRSPPPWRRRATSILSRSSRAARPWTGASTTS